MTSKNVRTEQEEAQISGPIVLKEPGTPMWCWQLIAALQTQWKNLNIDYDLYMRTWEDAETHQVWEKVPYDNPYNSKERMLEALEIGDIPAARARVAEKAMTIMSSRTNGGTRPDYLTARIARERPDVWDRMKQGEFTSIRAAAWEAGITLPTPPRKMTLTGNLDKVSEALREHYTDEQIKDLARKLLEGE